MSSLSARLADPVYTASISELVGQVDAWLSPIREDAPSGSDTCYHDAQLAIRHELDKLQSLTGQPPNWQLIFVESGRLLRTETKDLALAGFLTVALFELHRLQGLALGLRVITGIAERFWESCWPPQARVRQRVNTLQWALERVQASSGACQWTPADSAALAELGSASREFSRQMEHRLGRAGLDLQPLRDLVERIRAAALATAESPPTPPHEARTTRSASLATTPALGTASASAEEAQSAPPSGSPSAGARPHPPTGAVSTTAEASGRSSEQAPALQQGDSVAQLHALAKSVIELAQARFAADRTDPCAYRWLRVGLWLPWAHAPSAGPRGRTEISPPQRELHHAVQAAVREQRWEDALEQGEQLCRHNPFWLEGHWLSANTLAKLGEPYSAARASIELELRSFVRRVPRLCVLQFRDGSPLCPPALSGWLAAPGSIDEAAHEPALAGPAALADALPRGLLQDEALAKLRGRLAVTGDGRARFLLTLELAQRLHAEGRLDRALTLYLALERALEERRMWSWEPECCVHVLRTIVTLMSARSPHGVTGADEPELRRIRVRLAQLDPTLI